jgi:hypothetical protein
MVTEAAPILQTNSGRQRKKENMNTCSKGSNLKNQTKKEIKHAVPQREAQKGTFKRKSKKSGGTRKLNV